MTRDVVGLGGAVNKLGWILLIVVIIAIIGFWKRPKTALTAIAPKQCLFHIDDNWSLSFQEAIIRSITNSYDSNKNPDDVISKMTSEYPEISTVQAQICSSDKICFHVEASQPVFLLNDTHVVVATGHISCKDDFASEIQTTLPSVYTEQLDDTVRIVRFVQQLSPEISSCHILNWKSADTIILSHRDIANMQCIACLDRVPYSLDVQRCHQLYQDFLASLPAKKTKKKMMEYDIRFKNQIIVRPGG